MAKAPELYLEALLTLPDKVFDQVERDHAAATRARGSAGSDFLDRLAAQWAAEDGDDA